MGEKEGTVKPNRGHDMMAASSDRIIEPEKEKSTIRPGQ